MDYYFWVSTGKIKPDTRERFEQSWRPAEFPAGLGGAVELLHRPRAGNPGPLTAFTPTHRRDRPHSTARA
jgi:hypothetical protein